MRPLVAISFLMGALASVPALADEYAILRTTVNSVDCGDRFYLAGDSGNYFAKVADLSEFGIDLASIVSRVREVRGDKWISLDSMAPLVWYEASMDDLTIHIHVDASLLDRVKLDFSGKSLVDAPVNTGESSGFLNYVFSAQCSPEDWGNCYFPGMAELGIDLDGMLLFSDFHYHYLHPEAHFARGMTNLTVGFPSERSRLVVGDMYAMPTKLGSGGPIGGLGYWTEYSVDPYFVRYPKLSFAGTAATPSQIEIYVNDNMVQRQNVPAGQFDIINLDPTMGQGDVRILVRDAFGREHVITQQYFMAPTILASGVKEGGVYTGLLRSDYGTKNFSYVEPALFGRYRQGMLDWLTVGGNMEVSFDTIQTSLETSFLVFNTFAFSLDLAGSVARSGPDNDFGDPGAALGAGWHADKRPLSLGMDASYFLSSYETVVSYDTFGQRRLVSRFWTGLSLKPIGSFRMGVSSTLYYDGDGYVNVFLGYNRNLFRNLGLFVTGTSSRRIMEGRWQGEVFALLTYSFGGGVSSSGSFQTDFEGKTGGEIGLKKSPPFGEGFGGSADLALATSPTADTDPKRVIPGWDLHGTYRGRHGIWWSDIMRTPGGASVYSASAAGGLALVGGSLHATRPVGDSFGLVKAGDTAGVPVFLSNREVGKTDSDGEVFIPDLLSYQENNVSLDIGVLPLDYEVATTRKYLVPSYRSGVFCDFQVKRFTAVTGRVKTLKDGKEIVLKLGRLSLVIAGEEKSCPTGFDGEFYLENVPAGSHMAILVTKGEEYRCPLEVPEPKGLLGEIGEVICEQVEFD